MGLMAGKQGLVMGVANDRSIAWGVTKALHDHGAKIGLSYAGEILKKRVVPLAESIGSTFVEECDVTKDDDIAKVAEKAKAAFGNDSVYLEKFLEKPRHIEIQVIADSHGAVLHLGERDCSLQRRHQKVWEEAPSPALNREARERIGRIVTDALVELGYLGVGTVEFLYEDGEFYFIEMNTRLQVEHPVTELITGLDLVREQIRIADGCPLEITQNDVTFAGHAIECRVNAENPFTFQPSPGRITDFHVPGGLGVRMDSAAYSGYRIPPYYDSLVGKLIVHGKSRNECLMRLRRALDELVVGGIDTTIPLFQELIKQPDILDGNYDIHWLEHYLARRALGQS